MKSKIKPMGILFMIAFSTFCTGDHFCLSKCRHAPMGGVKFLTVILGNLVRQLQIHSCFPSLLKIHDTPIGTTSAPSSIASYFACKYESQRRRINISAFLEGETMRFTWLDSKAPILKKRKELIASLVAAAVVAAAGFAIGSASLASAQDLSRQPTAEAAFLKENDAATTKMMNNMAVKPTGDVDHDFVAMMAPHHQGAIDMSKAELRYGHNEQLIRIAQAIVVEELQEIAAMRAASGEKLTPTEATLAASISGTAAGRGFSPLVRADNVPP